MPGAYFISYFSALGMEPAFLKYKTMNIIKSEIEGVLIIEPRLFRDSRGYFFESFSEREFEEKVAPILGHSVHFCQDNESMSSYGKSKEAAETNKDIEQLLLSIQKAFDVLVEKRTDFEAKDVKEALQGSVKTQTTLLFFVDEHISELSTHEEHR